AWQVGVAPTTANSFQFYEEGPNVSQVTIKEGGNVGIGTTAPGYKLEVRSTNTGQASYIRSDATTGTNYGIDAEAMGSGATTNVGGYFTASGGTNNYALIV